MTEKEDNIQLDFSKLSKKLQTVSQRIFDAIQSFPYAMLTRSLLLQVSKDDEGRFRQQFEEKLQTINLAMQKMAPNLRALGHFNEVENRLRTTEDEFEAARSRAKKAAERFAAKKQERYDMFVARALSFLWLRNGARSTYLLVWWAGS